MSSVFRIFVRGQGDGGHSADLAQDLRQELSDQGVNHVRIREPGPDATDDGHDQGTELVVFMAGLGVGLRRIVSAIRTWLWRGGGTARTLQLSYDGDELEMSQASAAERDRLLMEWVARLEADGTLAPDDQVRSAPPPERRTRGLVREERIDSSSPIIVSLPDDLVFDEAEPSATPPPESGAVPVQPGKPATADVSVAADMPSRLQVGKVASVICRVSRNEIAAGTDRARAEGRVAADLSRSITLEVLPKADVEVIGEDRVDLPVPGEDETGEAYFDIRPTGPGTCQVWVVVRQGPVPLLTLRLAAPATLEPPAVPVTRYPVEARVAVGAPTGLEDGTWLSVVEMERGPVTVYRYELRSTALEILATFESPPLRNRAEYVANLYREIENRWLTSAGDVEAFGEELREFGGTLLSQLFPERLQEIMWRLRDRLKDLIVLSGEPFIPWELVHLKEPGQPLPDETRFLAETGLVRWLYTRDNAYPPLILRARPGQVRVLCPDYPATLSLPGTRAEADFLIASLGAVPVPAHEREVRALLRDGDFDILHFAGHGQADGGDIANAKIHLEGRMEGGTYVPSTISASTVDQQARLAGPEGSKPLVVLNACQAGRQGQQMSSLGGFAQAFLERGAGAFISSMWSVGDEPSSTFVTTFYRELLDGQTVSAAASQARRDARGAGDGTWLAYAVYAHPQARLLTSGPAAPAGAAR
jgi:CHAT domain